MRINPLHSWDLSPKKAIELQKELAGKISLTSNIRRIQYVAGADVSHSKGSPELFAAVVVLSFPNMEVVDQAFACQRESFPYIPGLLSFREAPVLLEAFSKIKRTPDVVLIDGQGIAHPRRFGIASHLGLFLGLPTIGCAKTRLVGEYEEPKDARGSSSPLFFKGKEVGAVLRTRDKVAPLFVSSGHKIDCDSAVKFMLDCCRGYRLPEPTRRAHLMVNELRRSRVKEGI